MARNQKNNQLVGESGESLIDYKNLELLQQYLGETGKIIPSRVTNVPVKQQRRIAAAVKHARFLALLPYCDAHS
ncbi:MAG: 30S ribosomal protein S18 [Methylococcales bacterium]|nr:30S ribosomal protein S18 [Methylococcales bacterium]